MKKTLFVGAAIALLLSGPAQALGHNNDQNLKIATATKIGNMLSGDIVLIKVERGWLNVEWTASTPTGTYRCESDDMVRRVNCVKVSTQIAQKDEG